MLSAIHISVDNEIYVSGLLNTDDLDAVLVVIISLVRIG